MGRQLPLQQNTLYTSVTVTVEINVTSVSQP